MKKLNPILIVACTVIGAGAGYMYAKEKKGKKPLDKAGLGAVAGSIVGLMVSQFQKEDNEVKISLPK